MHQSYIWMYSKWTEKPQKLVSNSGTYTSLVVKFELKFNSFEIF